MGVTYTDITLENSRDAGNARGGIIKDTEVRRLDANAMVDTGAWSLVINEEIRAKLGLQIVSEGFVEGANDNVEKCGITEPVTIYWKDRSGSCEAVVLPYEKEILLGALPLEIMDLMIHPRTQNVVGAHGDKPLRVIK